MNRNNHPSDDSLENDAVWDLLDQASPVRPRSSFADDVVRLAKLEPVSSPWWKNWRLLGPSLGLAATAAVALAFVLSPQADSSKSTPMIADVTTQETTDDFADLQEFAETETLIAAADHLDDFSDQELVGLIGF